MAKTQSISPTLRSRLSMRPNIPGSSASALPGDIKNGPLWLAVTGLAPCQISRFSLLMQEDPIAVWFERALDL